MPVAFAVYSAPMFKLLTFFEICLTADLINLKLYLYHYITVKSI